jgi:hypothetical protein
MLPLREPVDLRLQARTHRGSGAENEQVPQPRRKATRSEVSDCSAGLTKYSSLRKRVALLGGGARDGWSP